METDTNKTHSTTAPVKESIKLEQLRKPDHELNQDLNMYYVNNHLDILNATTTIQPI